MHFFFVTNEQLQNLYFHHPHVQSILNKTDVESKQKINLKGLCGSSKYLFAATVVNKLKNIHIFILNDKEEAAYAFNDFQSIFGDKQVFFFSVIL
jgi:transcription-repair coupling factor (superfamily II helicase)